MSRIGERRCLCCGADYLRGDVIGQCSNGCDFDWCKKCTLCPKHCACKGGAQLMFAEPGKPGGENG